MVMDSPAARLIEPLAGLPLKSAVKEYEPSLTVPDTFVITNLAALSDTLQNTSNSN